MAAKPKKITPVFDHVTARGGKYVDRVYEPEADSFLLLDALDADAAFLRGRWPAPSAATGADETVTATRCCEVGVGSGIALTHLCIHVLLGSVGAAAEASATVPPPPPPGPRRPVHALGIDLNPLALEATQETWTRTAEAEGLVTSDPATRATLELKQSSLLSQVPDASVDVLLFNPPYVPTSRHELLLAQIGAGTGVPTRERGDNGSGDDGECAAPEDEKAIAAAESATGSPTALRSTLPSEVAAFAADHNTMVARDWLPAAWAGGRSGREVCNALLDDLPRVLARPLGVAYVVALEENHIADMCHRVAHTASAAGLGALDAKVVAKRWTGEHLCIVRFSWLGSTPAAAP
jgi:hypothetical protein